MSDLRVNNLKARTDGNVPTIVGGAVISGITSITGVLEAESGITAENVSASGIATISTAIVGTAVTINSSGVDAGVVLLLPPHFLVIILQDLLILSLVLLLPQVS